MKFREAEISDYQEMHHVRMAVKENVLNNPALVSEADYIAMVTEKGKGWVCEVDNRIVGFAIVDISSNNIWALFILPEFERKGIGRKLFDMMIRWAFSQDIDHLWLSTSPGTRAEYFYKKAGWEITGVTKTGETRFEMHKSNIVN